MGGGRRGQKLKIGVGLRSGDIGAIREMKSQLQCGATYINNDSPSPQHVSLRLPPQLTLPANDNSDLPGHKHTRCVVDIKYLSCLLVCAV